MDIEKEAIILDAANKVFLKYGYQKTSMDDIAKEAMIGKGTIYYYFNSKEDIFVAVLKKASSDIHEMLKQKVDDAKSFEEKYEIFMVEPFDNFMKHSKIILQVLNDESHTFLKKIADFKQESIDLKRCLLLEIFLYAKENDLLKDEYAEALNRIVDVTFKWIMITGEYVKVNLSEEKIDDIKSDFLLMSKIFMDGLVKTIELGEK